jgi:hypothetical protein
MEDIGGGFLRDSAIHDNYFAYANDDIMELDGGQSNVLVYNNEIEQGFCGISAVPNMVGPNYIFNNYIHDIGDERGGNWAAVKLGGLLSAPAGKSHIFNNLIITSSNGISQSNWYGDRSYWMHTQNNIILTTFFRYEGYNKGLAIFDSQNYQMSKVVNNLMFNVPADDVYINAEVDIQWQNTINRDALDLETLKNNKKHELFVPAQYLLPNFSFTNEFDEQIIGVSD